MLRAEVAAKVKPFVLVAGDDALDGVLVFTQQGRDAVVCHFLFRDERQREVDKNKRRFSLFELRLKPVELGFTERSPAFVISFRAGLPGVAQEIIQVDEFEALIVQ